MKLPFTIHGSRFTVCKKSSRTVVASRRACADGNRKSSIINHKSESGIALIITLILLSVTLFMAIAFLAISRRERGSVTTSVDTATARLAADSALANAQAQIIANIFATTNPFNSGLLVSTNFINGNGFANGIANPTNVNYDYQNDAAHTPLTQNQFEQNIANLFLSPRAPVFVTTNQQTGSNEFRFYLDLNRNGKFEDSGNVPNVNNFGFTNFPAVSEIGDPQWIGVLERPDAPHGPNNKFLSRYAFIALPAGNSLDLNAIHNQVLNTNLNMLQDGYFRNQGVGSWEINLAAFLADLNTNEWDPPTVENGANDPYLYQRPINFPNGGRAFNDAFSLLGYRYNGNYSSLAFASALFANGGLALENEPMDIYPFGAAMINTTVPIYFNNPGNPWAGADNTNHFFDITADLFDATKTALGVAPAQVSANNYFTGRLLNAGTNVSTYDRYTYYRLLSQLGTDSTPESGKMNLNYDNLDLGLNGVLNVNGTASATNFVPWTPIGFFTNAADRMLRTYTTKWFQADPSNYLATYYNIHTNYFYTDSLNNVHTNDPNGIGLVSLLGVPNVLGLTNDGIPSFGVTNIPVYVNGRYVYSSAIQRVLQLAANIYDASTNRSYDVSGFPLPTVFRPYFSKVVTPTFTSVFICQFNEVTRFDEADQPLSAPFNLANPTDLGNLVTTVPNRINVFGVPMIIGAKKGLPNFNQFAMQNTFQITRKVQLTRSSTNETIAPLSSYKVNQMFTFGSATSSGVANQLEVEFWNSYTNPYTRSQGTDIYVTNWLTMNLTNDENFSIVTNIVLSAFTNVTQWPGFASPTVPAPSFLIPLNTTAAFVPTNSVYRFNSGGTPFLISDPTQSAPFETNVVGYPQPHWGLNVTNNIQIAMVDHLTGRIIDYVQLSGPNISRDINNEILGMTNYAILLQTNFVQSLLTFDLPAGISHQLDDSVNATNGWTQANADGFNNFTHVGNDGHAYGTTNFQFQAYSPPITIYQTTIWAANDPLVHYLASDLFDSAQNANATPNATSPLISTNSTNERYQPWGKSVQMEAKIPNVSVFNLALKDPLALNSDHWDFPANKFPTVGWLGRVHRGTPWQTVYLKSADILTVVNSSGVNIGTNTWMNWTGNFTINDAVNAAPEQDRSLFDIFTTALNDNATRGRLSINVAANPNDPAAGLAAWSALFSGVTVLQNNLSDAAFLQPPPSGGRSRGGGQAPSSAPALSYTNFLVDPAGVNGTNSPLGQLVVSINSTRTNTVLFPQQTFGTKHGVGDILAVPAFTDQSPFLNRDAVQLTNGISDELYEWLPQQTMGLLTVSSTPRYVIYSYGQTLKPAPNGIDTASGAAIFGMVTNYQVVSEIATRALVQVVTNVVRNANSTLTTNYTMKIEQFNVLPPD